MLLLYTTWVQSTRVFHYRWHSQFVAYAIYTVTYTAQRRRLTGMCTTGFFKHHMFCGENDTKPNSTRSNKSNYLTFLLSNMHVTATNDGGMFKLSALQNQLNQELTKLVENGRIFRQWNLIFWMSFGMWTDLSLLSPNHTKMNMLNLAITKHRLNFNVTC